MMPYPMSEVTCIFFERELKIRRSLRRYVNGDGPHGLCEAMVPLDEILWTPPVIDVFELPHSDPRWPTACVTCGKLFVEADIWQVFSDWLYRHHESGQLATIKEMPIGAIYRAHWYEDMPRWTGPDGHSLMCRLPDGHDWAMDAPSRGGGAGWTRTGVPPKITASPSIMSDKYHGYLVDGVLRSC